ncbi:MAG: glycosyltransferase family 39 protein [Chloroflexi bacterium]|nr:glycosyltransferase family 39 protein [Chloroflexota bacterium]
MAASTVERATPRDATAEGTPVRAGWLRPPSRSLDAVAFVGLLVAALVTFLGAVDRAPFHGDESEWIANGRYFRYVFLDHDLTSQVWRPSWLNRDQPPVGRYVIGAIVWASGTDPEKVNRTYAWDKDYAANLRDGRVPEPRILLPVRRAMAVLGALSVGLLYVVGRLLGGPLVGVVAALAAMSSPLLQLYFAQARTEALLAFVSTVALLGLLLTARRFSRDGRIPVAGWLVGVILGLALATKLTAALAIVGVCGYGAAAGLARLRASRREGTRLLAWAAVTGLIASGVWVAVNPFLWPDPVGRTLSMLDQQQQIMVEQGVQFGNPVHEDLPGRIWLLVRRTFVESSTPPFDANLPAGSDPLIQRTFSDMPAPGGISLELGLAVIGLGALLWRVGRSRDLGAGRGADVAFVCWLGCYALGIAANLSLDWPRYYVPTAFYGALLIGIGAATMVDGIQRLFARRGLLPTVRGPRDVEAAR